MSTIFIVVLLLWIALQKDEPRRINKKKLHEQRILRAKQIMEEHHGTKP